MRIHVDVTFNTPPLTRPRRPRTLVALGALVVALVLPAVALASHLFSDVPTSHTFHTNISNLANAGVTAGCGGGKYCPEDPVTRGQMAGFLNRGLGRIAETEWSTGATGTGDTQIGLVTILPGTATASGKQFIRAQYNGTLRLDNSTDCPCQVSVRLRYGAEGVNDYAVFATITTAGFWYPIHAGGVVEVTGTGPVTITLHTAIVSGGGASTEYVVHGNITAEAIPYGSTGTSAP